ncbi:MAG: DUF2130 domain-containing protein [Bacteroidetes bacterium]|nr:DUF2130 domain-containing protein [Bacteroidota bacterium]
MSNNSTIKCPNCNTEFELNKAMKAEIQSEFRQKLDDWKRKQEEDYKKREEELNEKYTNQINSVKKLTQEETKKGITEQFENELKLLREKELINEKKLEEARQTQLNFLKKEEELKNKEAEIEITIQKEIQTKRIELTEQIRKQELEKIQIKETESLQTINEYKKALDDQKKQIEEMRRKIEQGSMQLQGEVQEIALEELLKATYPFDLIEPVAKGTKGSDCIQTVKNNAAQICGKISYESKRTKAFANEWIEKAKTDMRLQQADIAVIVTEAMPKDMNMFGFKDGVWICRFNEIKSLSYLLRDGIIKIHSASANQENKGEKMTMLYNYLTSNEFNEQWQAIREGFLSMKQMIQKERDAMEKLWKAREKQLEKVLLNASHIKGSINGIAGSTNIDLGLEFNNDLLLD